MNAATEVIGVTTLKSVWPVKLCVSNKLSKSILVSRSVPPKLTKYPLSYRKVNLPSLSEVVELSLVSAIQSLSWSTNISAPLIYPSATTPLKFLYPSITTELVPEAPEPEQVIEKLLLPGDEMVTVWVPEVDVEVVHVAAQLEELVDDHVIVEFWPTKTEVGLADKFTVEAGAAGGESPPPPPPPPQEYKKIVMGRTQ